MSRAVLHWGNKPFDLDLYVIPIDAVNFDAQA